jgi:predicted ATPase
MFNYTEGAKSYMPSFPLGRTRSALANVPADQSSFPVSLWFREMIESGVQNFILDSQVIRQPSPPGLGLRFQTDGSNLPWVIHELSKDKKRYAAWVDHIRTALEDVRDIRTIEREEDRHRYLVIEYVNGASVPSWLVSDGTLRLLALTIPAYLKDMGGVFLIEEPENGIHPKAMETVIQSLTSIYHGQVLIATHSPVVINQLDASQVLCFAKDSEGATDIVAGNFHPRLTEWKKGEPDLGTLFAS